MFGFPILSEEGPPVRRFLAILVGGAVALAIVISTTPGASAMNMKTARHRVVGGSIYNSKTHILTSLSGTYKFHRIIRGKVRVVYGPKISAQHCYKLGTPHAHCKGRVIGGPLKAINAPGKPLPTGPHRAASGPPTNYCYALRLCTNPFYWTTGIADGIVRLHDLIIDPCESGGLKGFGGGVTGNLVAKAMLSSGAIGETTMLAKFAQPESIAFLSVVGCVGKVADNGTDKVSTFLTKLQHFGLPRTKEEAHHG